MTPKRLPPQKREYGEPSEAVTPLPRTLLVLMIALMSWGGWYLSQSAPEASGMLGDARTKAGISAVAVAAGPVSGAQLFSGKCAACHQATGLGLPGVFPPLAASEWVNGRDAVIVQILLHGINGEIHVRGVEYKGLMPPWKSLRDEEIAAVASYVRSSFGNKAAPITPALVAAERTKTAARLGPWGGEEELEKLP